MGNETLNKRLYDAYIKLNGAISQSTLEQEQIVASLRSDDGSLVATKKIGTPTDYFDSENFSLVDFNVFSSAAGNELKDRRLLIHQALYRTFPYIKGIVFTESRWCSIWSSLGGAMPPLSAMHARYFFGEVPCTPPIKRVKAEGGIEESFFENAGKAVIMALKHRVASQVQAVFVRNFGAVTWGSSMEEAANNAIALEELAFRAMQIRILAGASYRYLPYEISKGLYFEQPWHIPFETKVEKNSDILIEQAIEEDNEGE